MAEGDFLQFLEFGPDFCEKAAECGLKSFQIMAGALDRLAVKSVLLSYEGPFGVGYGVAAFQVTGGDGSRNFGEQLEARERARLDERKAGEDPYVRLARLTLETYVRTGRPAGLPHGLPPELTNRRAGVFVSLKKDGVLRGCIGTTAPTTGSVAEEIARNAVSSGTEDPRFPTVKPEELSKLVYSVDVLGESEPVSSKEELDVKRYGVIVKNGSRQGLLLPDLEGVDTVDEQVGIARRKAGIRPEEPCELRRFEVVRHK
jgi:AmmeMemoRadiSam system protein A